ncbi:MULTISPECIES: AraC family transcriptional regulator [unclassified Vibrio]|uniref:AraC family transcriptional regulator n=1 Tax=unclassified Vibrio TaxID=2614977 RepID=UPI001F064860|nr:MULTISPECIES: AraC family transcriptional regulator [unclassified Vibrio]MCF4171853.1 AraC family transcriptional regulator [Vibrio sp. McD22-P3]
MRCLTTLTSVMVSKRKPIHLNRVEKIVDYIHQNLDKPLTVTELADISCWSRWQLQRVFQEQTNHNLAQYVREQKLSRAAEQLLKSDQKVTDIALDFGFNSEVSFSRAFKQLFAISPRQYRLVGKLNGIRLPLVMSPELPLDQAATQVVRIESKPETQFWGVYGPIDSIYAANPQFSQQVLDIWGTFTQIALQHSIAPNHFYYGIVDTVRVLPNSQLVYWAASDNPAFSQISQLEHVTIPAQMYAVITHVGPAATFPKTLEWVLQSWLPSSGYMGLEGFELECYPRDYQLESQDAKMEFWLPIQSL